MVSAGGEIHLRTDSTLDVGPVKAPFLRPVPGLANAACLRFRPFGLCAAVAIGAGTTTPTWPKSRLNGGCKAGLPAPRAVRLRIPARSGYNPFVREDHMAKDRSPKKEVKKPKKKK